MRLKIFLSLLSLAFHIYSCEAQCSYSLPKSYKSACDIQDLEVTSRPGDLLINNENCDTLVPKPEFKDEPSVKYADAVKDKLYTVVMVDPDAPNHNGKYFLHWLITNVKGTDLRDGTTPETDQTKLQSWYPPKPPQGTGKHRYMFLIFEQSGNQNQELTGPKERRLFDLGPWIDEHKGKLCDLVAGIQFRTEF